MRDEHKTKARLLEELAALRRQHGDQQARFEALLDAVDDLVFFKDRDGRYSLINQAFTKRLGVTPAQIIGKSPEDLLPAEAAAICRRNDQTVIDRQQPLRSEEQFADKAGRQIFLEVNKVLLRDAEGAPAGLVAVARDITTHKQAADALQRSEEKFRHLFEAANDGIFIVDLHGKILDSNRIGYQRLGYTKDELLAMDVFRLNPPEAAAAVQERLEDLKKHGRAVTEATHVRKDGSLMPVEVSSRLIKLAGRKVLFSVARDITDRKTAEQALKAALAEKEVLLREIYHRTKNNMEVICGLLTLQSLTTANRQLLQVFRETKDRIRAMALVHEKLYQARDLSNINLKDYIRDLADYLLANYGTNHERISLHFEAEDIRVVIDTAVPCGLIVNELLSNALKHAFPDDRAGEIRISLQKLADGEIALAITDNGIGLPRDFDLRNNTSVGLQIVTSLAEVQLHGKVEITSGPNGAAFLVKFKELKRLKRI